MENLITTINGIEYVEEWRDVPTYEYIYQVSSFGRIKSLDRIIVYKNGNIVNQKGMIRRPQNDKDGYQIVVLCKKNKRTTKKIHRLVCLEFHENPENKPEVNHKDGIKSNNYEWNLEWSTISENKKHAYRNGLMKPNYAMRAFLDMIAFAVSK